jgi:2-oxo-3-hexenedioate decarboxylase
MIQRETIAEAGIDRVAAETFDVLNAGRQIEPFSSRDPSFDLAQAYQVTAAVRRLREERGERTIGRKIGFTNRTIWDEYGVSAPMWGYVYDQTVCDLPGPDEPVSLAGLAEPRIEPEIVFGLALAPTPDMDERALLGCLAWLAHGFEIVQSIFPRWEFALADTVAGYGLHGRLLIGPRHEIADVDAWHQELSAFEIDLLRNGEPVDHGWAANVLGGPLSALRHLVAVLAIDSDNPPLAAGEIVTTGTLTRAFPVFPGEAWSTRLSGIDVDGVVVRFS